MSSVNEEPLDDEVIIMEIKSAQDGVAIFGPSGAG